MAAAAPSDVKLPLSVRKDIRDGEAKKVATLVEISEIVGAHVTMNWSPEGVFKALEGHDSQGVTGSAILGCYLDAVLYAFQRHLKDQPQLVKDALLAVWTTKNITWTVEPAGFHPKADAIATDSLYNGWRITSAGDLDIYIPKDRWYSNVDYLSSEFTFDKLLANAHKAEELPVAIRKELLASADAIQALEAEVTAATGVATKWDAEADARVAVNAPGYKAMTVDRYPWTVDFALCYLRGVSRCLTKACADEMVKEAVVEGYTGRIGLKIVPKKSDYDALPKSAGDSYTRIQFADGGIWAAAPAENFGSNIDSIEYHDIVPLF